MVEILDVLNYWRYWFFKAIFTLQNRYKHTFLGLLWEPFSLLFITLCISLIWSRVLGEREFLDFFLYLFTGYYVWSLLSSIVLEGIKVFEIHTKDLTNEKKSLLFYILEDLTLSIVKFLLVFPLVIFVTTMLGHAGLIKATLLFLLVLVCIVLSGVGFMVIFGAISIFFKDIRMLIQSIMRLAFLLTPIIWRPERLGDYASYIWLNPFYVYVEAFRQALLLGNIDLKVLLVLLIQTFFIIGFGAFMLSGVDQKVRRQAFVS